jgi:Xaa-Pro aminopeptidase
MNHSNQLQKSHTILHKTQIDLAQKHDQLEQWCLAHSLDAVFITAQDSFLSEYTPLSANQRYQVSGFSGSTGDGVFVTKALAAHLKTKGRFHLFVDGRYHLQADQETNSEFVEVHKFSLSTGMDEVILSWIESAFPQGTRVGVDAQRVSWGRWEGLQKFAAQGAIAVHGFGQGEIGAAIQAEFWKIERPIEILDHSITGRTMAQNLTDLRKALRNQLGEQNYVYATCMSDDAAWILNARGYHLPQLSSILAYTFTTKDHCLVHLPEESSDCPIDLSNTPDVFVTRGALSQALEKLRQLTASENKPSAICFSARAMNAALPLELKKTFQSAEIQSCFHCVEELRVAKTETELNAIRSSFLRSSRAIAETLRWIKSSGRSQTPITEADVAERISAEYGKQGAIELSFKTISGFAENGAVIHYSNPSSAIKAKSGDLLLLDSGAYYNEGFATDCTRVSFYSEGAAQPIGWQKEIYTLTLKSCLAGLRATFNLNTPCREVDAICRSALIPRGYDYAHGTGHGIGIHVHENGIRISPTSQYTFTENAVVSVEPGVYLSGRGGVRIENVAIVVPREPTQEDKNTHTFENVVFVGYDWDLIDINLLDEQDKADLSEYEKKCLALGTQVTHCPLV